MQTYIIKIKNRNEFYCGKTEDLRKRLQQHKNEELPHWFGYEYRKAWDEVIYIDGDFEKQIKRAGVEMIYVFIKSKWRSAS